MSGHRSLQDELKAWYQPSDPGTGQTFNIDRNYIYFSIINAGVETRTVPPPLKPGLTITIGNPTYVGNTVVTVQGSTGNNTGTITTLTTGIVTYTAAGQYIQLSSMETTVVNRYEWQVVGIHGCTTTVPQSASFTGVTATSGAFNSLTATALQVGAGVVNLGSALSMISSVAPIVTAGCSSNGIGVASNWNTLFTVMLNSPVNLISCANTTNNYFRLPAPTLGVVCDVLNLGASTCVVIGNSSAANVCGASTINLATMNAAGSAVSLICDGTSWWKQAV